MNCPKCNRELENDAKFCVYCGERIPEAPAAAPAMIFCTNCGTKTNAGSAFCENCGARIDDSVPVAAPVAAAAATAATAAAVSATPEAAAVEAPAAAPKTAKPAFKFTDIPKKWWKIGGIALAALVVLIVAIVIITTIVGNNARKNYAVYMKDHELMFYGIGKDKKFQLTDDLTDGMDDDTMANSGAALSYYTIMTDDNQRLFFLDEVNDDGEATLYYIDLYKDGAKPKEVDTVGLSYPFAVNKDGTKVVFYRDGDLYEHDLKDRTKIDSEVSQWYASEDCKKVVYRDSDGNLYEKSFGKDKEKIDSSVSSVYYVSDDCKTVLYEREDNLYVKKSGKDKEKIASEIYGMVEAYSEKSVYYVLREEVTIVISDYIEDDLAASDATVTKPVYPTYSNPSEWSSYTAWPSYSDFASYDEYYEAYQEVYSAYQAAITKYNEDYEVYDAKNDRDYIRNNLSNYDYTQSHYTLYYFDGKDSTVVSEGFGYDSYMSASDKAVMLYEVSNTANPTKIKISEVSGSYDAYSKVREALSTSSTMCVAVGKTVTTLDIDEETAIRTVEIDPAGKSIYYITSEDDVSKLYKITIADGKPGKAEKVDEEVYTGYTEFVGDGKFVYFKDYDSSNSKGDLYMDAKLIDSDVYVYSVHYDEDNDAVLYFVDWNYEKKYGTFKQYKDGKVKKIADDVHSYGYTSKGELLYLYDYSMSSYSGDLYMYTDGKAKKVDTDVNAIISMNLK